VSIWYRRPQRTLIRMCGVSIDAFFHGGLNETIRGLVRPRLLEISPFWFEVVLTSNGKSAIVEERILRFVFVPSIVEEQILRFVFVPSIVEEQILWFVFVPSIV
jgi:hypothetical protein